MNKFRKSGFCYSQGKHLRLSDKYFSETHVVEKENCFLQIRQRKKLQASEPLIEHYVYQNFVLWAMTINVYIHLSPWIRLCAFTAFHYG